MTIPNAAVLKVVQAINLPQSVEAINIYYFDTAFQAEQEEQDVLDELELRMEGLYGYLTGYVSDQCSLGVMTLYRAMYGTETYWELEGTASPTVTFASTDDMLPHGVSLLTRAYTTRARTIGRKYLPGMSEGTIEDGVWNSTVLAAMASFNALWGTALNIDANNQMNPSVFSTVTEFSYELTDEYVILSNAAYQRRRRPGVGS